MSDERPKTFGECKRRGLPEGCPFVSCVHHLALEVRGDGAIKVMGMRVWARDRYRRSEEILTDKGADAVVDYIEKGHPTCSLAVAEDGERRKLQDIADGWGVSRQRVEQIQNRQIAVLRKNPRLRQIWEDHREDIGNRPSTNPFELVDTWTITRPPGPVDRRRKRNGATTRSDPKTATRG